jgi:hypothetical protein
VLNWLKRKFKPELRARHTKIGDPLISIDDIKFPFLIKKGRNLIKLEVEEAENLRDWLIEELKHLNVRRPVTLTFTVKCK